MRSIILSAVACLVQLSGKKLLNIKMRVLILSGTFVILKRTERDMIKIDFVIHVKYPVFLSDCNET
jgi:hypothetical protein